MFKKRRKILIDKTDIVKTLEILDRHEVCWQDLANLKIGRCGWAKAPDCWFIHISVNDKKWFLILKEFKEGGIELLSETIGY